MHHNVLDALCRKFGGDSFRHLLRIAVHGTVCNDHTLIGGITAQFIIDADYLSYIFRPHRSMRRADGRNRQSAQLRQRLLHRRTVFTDNIGVIAHHLIPISVQIDTCIKEAAVQRAEAAEAVTGEENTVCFVKSHHRLGPMHHRRHVETEFMMPQCQEIFIFHHILFARHTIEPFDHTESLLIAYDNNVRIMLLDKTYRAGMVRLHVVYDQILNRTFTYNALNLTKIYFKITDIHCINQCNSLIVYQVRVV